MTHSPAAPARSDIRSGRCLCGKVRFTAGGEPDYPHTCSCRHCQKLSGGPMMSWVSFPLRNFTWLALDDGRGDGSGEPAWYYTFPDETRRGFCLSCGSQICALDEDGDSIAVTLSALDHASDLVPVNQSFRADAVPWIPQVPDTRAAARS